MIKSLKKQNIAIKTITHVVKDPSTSPQAIKKKMRHTKVIGILQQHCELVHFVQIEVWHKFVCKIY